MTRRQALRNAMLCAVGMTLGKFDAVIEAKSGLLTVNFSEWRTVVFTLGKRQVVVPVAEIFKALEEGRG
jgi:hypothetical protein